jgi:MFS transporter, ACS family, allantoate permease
VTGGISNFFSLLIKSFGYTPEQSLLCGTPAGAVEIIALWIFALLGDRLKNRIIVSSFSIVISILGMALIVGLNSRHNVGRLFGYYLTQTYPAAFVALLSMISTNIAGYTKKTTVAALYLIGYCTVSLF